MRGSLYNPLVGLYYILFYFENCWHESIILVFPPPSCIVLTNPILLHVYCAIYEAPPDHPFVCHTPYNIGNGNIV